MLTLLRKAAFNKGEQGLAGPGKNLPQEELELSRLALSAKCSFQVLYGLLYFLMNSKYYNSLCDSWRITAPFWAPLSDRRSEWIVTCLPQRGRRRAYTSIHFGLFQVPLIFLSKIK
ncbi:hypothetical protein CR201_G0013104 [Pongo abelii]|uniref:Uncharacterized protein n=1 Tax=Pongo abelii TaxID=9601 RepID=A0A2J8W5X2_PONAB|nr:hypothetical protein CR201_G0013104 [Pongo abelii]